MTTSGRPRVVVVTTASLDGRITLGPTELLLDPDVGERWRDAWPSDLPDLLAQRQQWLAERHGTEVVLEGSGSFVDPSASSPFADAAPRASEGGAADGPRTAGRSPELFRDHLPRRAPNWFVVVDGRGRVDWRFTGDDRTALLVLVCRSTPLRYLEQLHDKGVGHLYVGEQTVDLDRAIRRLGEVLGARAVLCEGGGGLNGALLRAGLVDEIHVITVPALVGGLTTPSMVDGPALAPGSRPVRLRPGGLVQGQAGSIWTWYEVIRD